MNNNLNNNITNRIAIIQNNIETKKANTLKNELKKFLLQEIKNILKSKKTEYYIFYRLPIKELEEILYDIVKEKVNCSKEISYEVINKILNDYEEDVKYCETLEKHLLFTLENNLKKENIEFEKLTNPQLLNILNKIKNSEKFFKPLQINNKILDRLKLLRKNNQFEEIEEKNLKEEFIPVLGKSSNFFNIFNTASFNINKIEKEFNEKKENEINKYLKNFLITEAEKTNNLKNYNSNELKKLLINIAENNEEIKKYNESFIINLINEILMEHSNKQKENINENLKKSKDFIKKEIIKTEKKLNETEKEKTLKKLIEDVKENLYLNIENLGKNSDITINEILVDFLNFSTNYTKEEKKYLNNLISKNKLFEKVENLKEFEISTSKKDERENVFENYAMKDDEEIEIINPYAIENEKEKNIFKNYAIKNDENISNEITEEEKQMALTKFSANLNSLGFKMENLKENSADANKEIFKELLEYKNTELEYQLNKEEKEYLKELIENGTILEKLERFLD